MATPSGRRSSEPMPEPKASGMPLSSAAMVVIMIGPEAQQRGLIDGVGGVLALLALGFQGEIDHHDAVLLHDADQQDDADDGDDVQIQMEQHQRQQRAHAGRRQRGKNRDRMHEALVQHAQNDVDGHQRRQNQQTFVGQRALESRGRALIVGHDAGRQVRPSRSPFSWRPAPARASIRRPD